MGRKLSSLTAYKGILAITALGLIQPAFAQTTTAVNQTKAPAIDLSPNLYNAGFIFQSIPQVNGKNQATVMYIETGYTFAKSNTASTTLDLEFAGSSVWTEFNEKNKSQLDSTEIYLTRNNQFTNYMGDYTFGVKAALPSNENDRTTGFNYAAGLVMGFVTHAIGTKFTFVYEPVFYNYNFETSDQEGNSYNTKFSNFFMIKSATPMGKSFKWRNTVRLFQYQNFANNTYSRGFLGTNVAYAMSKSAAVYIGAATTERLDKVNTTEKAFSKELVNIRAGLEWTL